MTISLYRTFASLLLVINFSGAFIAGWSFMHDPSGAGVGISVDWLSHSPFHDYFIPGLILFLLNGVYGVIVLASLLWQYAHYPLLIMAQGILLGGWILVQMVLLRTINFLQTTCFTMAVAFIVLGILLGNMETRKSKRLTARTLRFKNRSFA